MMVNLAPMQYKHAKELLQLCVEKRIDMEHVYPIMEVMAGEKSYDEVGWTIEVPDKYITFFLIKWSKGGDYTENL